MKRRRALAAALLLAAALGTSCASGEEAPYSLFCWRPETMAQEEWAEDRESLMQGFADGMTLAHSRAQELGLELLLCVPTFYDADCPQALERLVQHGCDGIAVMNYNRTDEYGQILEEARLAEQYGKRLIHVAELQPPGEHDLTEINTYYHLGLGVLHASWDSLAARIPYQRLSFSYHYYAPLAELLEQEGQPAG